jgi:hypothetical protein
MPEAAVVASHPGRSPRSTLGAVPGWAHPLTETGTPNVQLHPDEPLSAQTQLNPRRIAPFRRLRAGIPVGSDAKRLARPLLSGSEGSRV